MVFIERTDNMAELFSVPPVIEEAEAVNGERIVLRPLTDDNVEDISRFINETIVYRYLPTFLFEKKYEPDEVIRRLYTEALKDSLILGVFACDGDSESGRFCGLAEVYGYRAPAHKASIGCRLLQEAWGKGYTTRIIALLTEELMDRRGIEIITASTMIENRGSARALEKNDFTLVVHAAEEDWGFPQPTLADKWIR